MFSAKSASLFAQVVAAVWIAGFSMYKFFALGTVEMSDIMMSGFSIAGCFCPVYLNLVLDKFRNMNPPKES